MWQRAGSFAACLVWASLGYGQNLQEFEKRVSEFSLPNGLHFIVLERHAAPVVSFYSYVNVGSVDDPGGKSSMAHMFEHMIGKGTTTVGTRDYAAERVALEAVEKAYDALEAEQRKAAAQGNKNLEPLEQKLQAAVEKANSYVVPNEYVRLIEENGAVGFNAGTGQDSTNYFYSLPSNRVELWFLLQSEWFRRPVFREFYKERDVVREERRMRVESSAIGKLEEVFLGTAFLAHPYRNLVGWASDIEALRAKDAEQFFRSYYVPGNITIAIAGDVQAGAIRQMAERYFAGIPSGPLPSPVVTVEPAQEGARRATVETPSQPYLMVGYQRPDQFQKDDPVFDVIAGVLSSGRTGLLYQQLVRDQRISLSSAASATFPSGKYANLFVVYSVPAPGKTVDENEKALYAVIESLKARPVPSEVLDRVKTKVRAGLIRQLASNSGLAAQLAFYSANYGDWRKLFTGLEEIRRVTAADVQRVARQYLTDKAKTVAYTVAPAPAKEQQ